MMDNKLSELKAAALAATQGPWFRSSVQFNGITTEETFITQGNKPHLANTSEKRDAIFIAAANPAVVLALLAELEAKDIRIAELEAIRAAAEKLVRCKGRYHSEQNYRSLAAMFGVTTPDLPPVEGDSEAVIAELSANLAELETHNKCLIKKNADLTQQNIKLGERLAAPVRLPALLDAPSEYASSILWAERDTHNATVIKFADAIRAAGFKVEGDE